VGLREREFFLILSSYEEEKKGASPRGKGKKKGGKERGKRHSIQGRKRGAEAFEEGGKEKK